MSSSQQRKWTLRCFKMRQERRQLRENSKPPPPSKVFDCCLLSFPLPNVNVIIIEFNDNVMRCKILYTNCAACRWLLSNQSFYRQIASYVHEKTVGHHKVALWWKGVNYQLADNYRVCVCVCVAVRISQSSRVLPHKDNFPLLSDMFLMFGCLRYVIYILQDYSDLIDQNKVDLAWPSTVAFGVGYGPTRFCC